MCCSVLRTIVQLVGGHRNIADALALAGVADIAFDPPRVNIDIRSEGFSE